MGGVISGLGNVDLKFYPDFRMAFGFPCEDLLHVVYLGREEFPFCDISGNHS